LLEEDQDNDLDSLAKMSTPKKRKSRAKGKSPISEDEVRRSTRLKKQNKGFKSSCKDRNCLGCSSTPPTISTKVIRNLGVSFCGINPEDLSEQKLSALPKKKIAVSQKKAQKKAKSKSKPVDSSSDEEDVSGPQ
jgi:hypothetical protein